MSASLVGSEMCIRDSLNSHSCLFFEPNRQGLLANRSVHESSWVSGRKESVSYTHLTLPTICSV
eukprot:13615459-Alexandrium_andersonii.AAC.1